MEPWERVVRGAEVDEPTKAARRARMAAASAKTAWHIAELRAAEAIAAACLPTVPEVRGNGRTHGGLSCGAGSTDAASVGRAGDW
jgi:hypothetical protein